MTNQEAASNKLITRSFKNHHKRKNMRRKITIVGALLLCAILLTSASYFIRIERDCFYAHGWPISMQHEFKPAPICEVPNDFVGGVECDTCDIGSYEFPLEGVAPIINTIFWLAILSVIYLPIAHVRRKQGSPRSSTGQPGDQSIDTSRDGQ